MYRTFLKICNGINKLYEALALLLLTAMTSALALQVFTRYILGASMAGTEEFARYAFIWIIMLGASICIQNGSHATVTILNDNLHGTLKQIHKIIIQLLVLLACCVLVRYGFTMIAVSAKSHTPTLGLPTCFIYAALPVGCFGMMIGTLSNILGDIFANKEEGV